MTALACPHCGKRVGIPDGGRAGQQFRCPHCRKVISLAERAPQPIAESPAALPPDWIALDEADGANLAESLAASLTVAKKRRSNAGRWLIPGGLFAGVFVVAAVTVWDHYANRVGRPAGDRRSVAADENGSRRGNAAGSPHDPSTTIASSRPISLLLAPAGVRIAIYLRPSQIWAGSASTTSAPPSRAAELRQCLGPVSAWAERQIAEHCLFEPREIDEVLFSFVLRSPGELPDVAATVWLKEAKTESEIAKKFGGQKAEHATLATWFNGERALVVRNGKLFAVGPKAMSQEMADSNEQPNPTDESIEELLKVTDRENTMTLVFRPDDLDRFRDSLVPEPLQSLAHRVADWLAPEATEGAVLSFRLGDPFRVRLALRSRSTQSVRRLEEQMQQSLDRLPTEILAEVERLEPQTVGHRKLVGRVPAMWKAVTLGMQEATQPRLVVFESILPERAAANLALGSCLALSEPRSQSRSKSGRNRRPGTSDQQKTIAERLSTKIDVDFRRTPISEAFSSIGEDLGVTFEIDGGALKLAGYTKNMPQTFRLNGVPGTEVLRTILKQYGKMALVADEPRQTVIVTTVEAATEKGQEPLQLQK
jgi:hypothetical protein